MPKILVTTSSFAVHNEVPLLALTDAGFEVATNPLGRTLSESEVGALLAEHQPVGLLAGVEPLTAQVLGNADSHLKVISRCGTGLDNVDLKAAKKLGIPVLNTPEAPAEAVAELTLALILALIRNIPFHDADVKAGLWKKRMGFLLPELTIGILGLGRVGKRIATLLQPFGCKIIGSDVKPDADWIATHHVELVEIPQLLKSSDVVTLHLPYSSGELHHLINAERLATMKRGSFLINTSRGGLIDDNAVADALERGQLLGAAMDTFEEEPYHGPLLKAPRIILSPHAGSYARATRGRMEFEAAKNLISALNVASRPV